MTLCETAIDDFPALNWDGPVMQDEPPKTRGSRTSNYQSGSLEVGNSHHLCGLVALNYARLAFKTKAEGLVDTYLLQRLVSQTMIDEAISPIKDLKVPYHLDLNDLLELPIFERTLAASKTVTSDIDALADILTGWFTDASDDVNASVFTNDIEVVVCLKITTCGSHSYVLFDSRSRANNSWRPSLTRADRIDQLATSLAEALRPSSPNHVVNDTNTTFSAHMLTQKAYADEKGSEHPTEKSRARFPGLSSSAEDLMLLPSVVSQHLAFLCSRAENPKKTISRGKSNAESAIGTSVNGSNTQDKSSDEERQWEEFVWQLSLQNPLPDSMGRDADEDEQKLTSLRTSQDRSLGMRNKENIPPVASSSRRSEYSLLTTIVQYQGSAGEVEAEIFEKGGTSGTSRAIEKSVNLSKTASQCLKTEDTWETALLQQLQDEEEIAYTLPHQTSSEYTWLVALQKQLQVEESLKSGNNASTSISPSELDWQLAVQLQQEVYQEENPEKQTPRIIVESENDNGEGTSGDSRPSTSNTQSDFLRVPETRGYGDSFGSLDLYTHIPSEESFQCGVCGDMHRLADTVTLQVCSHRFCKECLTAFIKTKIEEGRYPIFCPECLAERSRTAKTHILQDTIDQLDLTSEELRRLCELEMISHSVALECPRCKETMNVDRDEYSRQSIIVCPLPRCSHKWCKSCLKTVASSEENHRCKNGNIDRLMKRKGWKYCPGCRTPVQKESGCNHMTCGAPGCNVHFCYRCGVLMIDTTNGGDVGTAVTDHYNECRLFEKRLRCSIQ